MIISEILKIKIKKREPQFLRALLDQHTSQLCETYICGNNPVRSKRILIPNTYTAMFIVAAKDLISGIKTLIKFFSGIIQNIGNIQA